MCCGDDADSEDDCFPNDGCLRGEFCTNEGRCKGKIPCFPSYLH